MQSTIWQLYFGPVRFSLSLSRECWRGFSGEGAALESLLEDVHYTEELKLSEMANLFGYSDAYLSRMFKKYAKINFKTYLQEIRMSYAYRELMNTETILFSLTY